MENKQKICSIQFTLEFSTVPNKNRTHTKFVYKQNSFILLADWSCRCVYVDASWFVTNTIQLDLFVHHLHRKLLCKVVPLSFGMFSNSMVAVCFIKSVKSVRFQV